MAIEIVALIDDHPGDLQLWKEHLANAGITASIFNDKDEFSKSVQRGDHFDAIVLDWLFEHDSSSIMAQLILEQLVRPNLFVPVMVYTNQGDIARDEIQILKPPFNRIQVVSKDDVRATDLAGELKKWYAATTGARISTVWRKVRRIAFEQALYELDALEGENLQVTLQHLITTIEAKHRDADHALDFLERLVGRKVLSNPELRDELSRILDETPEFDKKQKIERSKPMTQAHCYIPVVANEKFAHTGDVVDVYDAKTNEYILTGVTITPACDLDQRKCRELRLLIGHKLPLTETSEGEQWWEMPALARQNSNDFESRKLNFHRSLCLIDKSMERDAKKPNLWSSALTYDKVYEDIFGKAVHLKPICRLDDPYRADLLQKFSSHAARIGLP